MIYTTPYTHRPRKDGKPAPGQIRYRLHIVSHTHWDREWYQSFQQYRMRLVRMADRLLELLERSPEFRYFVFDGQTIVLEDYLAIRPENRERLLKLVQAGRLEVGPWYVLPDEFLVSGEALIRNLLLGQRTGQQFGSVMKVGYMPDSFGHIAQLPQILRGFGIDNFIFTRGMSAELSRIGSEFLWIAPDGSRVLAVNQLKGYCNGDHIGFEFPPDHTGDSPRFDLALDFFKQEIAELGEAAKRGNDGSTNILINNGCDHREPQADLPRILAYVNSVLPDVQAEHTTFSRYINTLRRAGLTLSDWNGEIHGGKDHPILSGVWSSRVYLKQQNDECETWLSHLAEPLGIMLWQRTGHENYAGFLQHAWQVLLQNHPHDSICGCSIDQVHRDMLPRFEKARQIARLAASTGLEYLAANLRSEQAPAVVAVNTLAFPRTRVLRSFVLIPPGKSMKSMTLVDQEGKAVPTHVLRTRSLSSHQGYVLPEAFLHQAAASGVRPLLHVDKQAQLAQHFEAYGLSPRQQEKPWKLAEVEYLAAHIPATGYRMYALRDVPATLLQHPVLIKGKTVENQFFGAKFSPDGSFELFHKASKRRFGLLNVLEDSADVGDEYDYSSPRKNGTLFSRNRRGQIKIIHRSPLCVEIEVKSVWALPAKFDRGRQHRGTQTVKCPLRWKFTVTAAAPWVEVELTLENLALDHRLRVHFPTPIGAQTTRAGQPFHIMERPVKTANGKGWLQPPSPTTPMQHFCAVEDRRGGLAIFVNGLYEYEALKQKGGKTSASGISLAVTLLRAVGWLSRDDLAARPGGNAGPHYVTPEAQCPGLHTFRFAVMPYSGNAMRANLQNFAQDFRVPVLEELCKGRHGNLPAEFSLFQCEPESLVVTAIKKCESRNTTIVRLYNTSSERVKGKMAWGMPVLHAWRVNMSEERLEEIPVLAKSRLEIEVPAWRILTLELEAGKKLG
ncbi:MAG: alpha-mannosidase [bacterium]